MLNNHRYYVVRTRPDGTQRRISDLLTLEDATTSCDRLNAAADNPEFSVHQTQSSAEVAQPDTPTEG
ncbi:hypothetical protein ACXYTP_23475 [Tsukamurella ocularis]